MPLKLFKHGVTTRAVTDAGQSSLADRVAETLPGDNGKFEHLEFTGQSAFKLASRPATARDHDDKLSGALWNRVYPVALKAVCIAVACPYGDKTRTTRHVQASGSRGGEGRFLIFHAHDSTYRQIR